MAEIAAPTLTIVLPGSKSETQRALVLAALAEGTSELCGALDCDDSVHLRAALRALGVTIDEDETCWRVHGKQWRPWEPKQPGAIQPPPKPRNANGLTLWCGDAGTTSRFLAPFALLSDKPLTLDGSKRLRERPLGQLVTSLRELGIEANESSLPVRLQRLGPPQASVRVDTSVSSQFASALLMVAPLLQIGLRVDLIPPQDQGAVSWPYIEMTLKLMEAFGCPVKCEGGALLVAPGRYQTLRHQIEGDWSAAAFWLVAARLLPRPLRLPNLRRPSLQGDSAVELLLEQLDDGASALDLSHCPDLLPPLAIACLFAGRPTAIVGVAHARAKECDRVATLAEGLSTAGFGVQECPDGLRFDGKEPRRQGALGPLRTDNDHRMAMAFGLLALRYPAIRVDNSACVSKSYPGFWNELERWRTLTSTSC